MSKCLLVKLSYDTDCIVLVEDIEDFTDVFLPLKNLENLNLAECIEQNAISIVECIQLALLDCNDLCLICLRFERVLSIVLWEYLVK